MTTIDYGAFAQRLAACRDRGDRWALMREVQREWGVDVEDEFAPRDGIRYRRHLARAAADPTWTVPEDDEFEFEGVDVRLPIPRALDEWWRLPFNAFWHDARAFWVHSIYPPSAQTDEFPEMDHRACAFLAEYQYCTVWAYPADAAGHDDPPALMAAGRTWQPHNATLSEFFLQMVVQGITFKYGHTARLDEAPPGFDPSRWPSLGFPPWQQTGVRMYGAPDAIIFHGPEMFAVAGRTPEAQAAILTAVGGG